MNSKIQIVERQIVTRLSPARLDTRFCQLSVGHFECVCATMASQNVARPSRSSAQKGVGSAQSGAKDGHSVANRLQQDLLKLMVSLSPGPAGSVRLSYFLPPPPSHCLSMFLTYLSLCL